MPIKVKTMRDVWDKGNDPKGTSKKEKKGRKFFSPEIEEYYLDYLARKKAFLETKGEIAKISADYEKKLGGAGFSKI